MPLLQESNWRDPKLGASRVRYGLVCPGEIDRIAADSGQELADTALVGHSRNGRSWTLCRILDRKRRDASERNSVISVALLHTSSTSPLRHDPLVCLGIVRCDAAAPLRSCLRQERRR